MSIEAEVQGIMLCRKVNIYNFPIDTHFWQSVYSKRSLLC